MMLDHRHSSPSPANATGAPARAPATPAPFVRLLPALAAALLLAQGSEALAQPADITQTEMSLLPQYCADAQTFNGWGQSEYNRSPNAPKWLALMGNGFWTMHHYCWALIRLGRIKSNTPPVIQTGHREAALGDLYFVVKNTPPDFIMLPEIYTKIGEVDLALRRITDASEAFARARDLKPDYWPAYSHWAEYLMLTGQKAKAREVLEAGLANAPSNATLQSMYRELGGNPGTVKPAPVTQKREPE